MNLSEKLATYKHKSDMNKRLGATAALLAIGAGMSATHNGANETPDSHEANTRNVWTATSSVSTKLPQGGILESTKYLINEGNKQNIAVIGTEAEASGDEFDPARILAACEELPVYSRALEVAEDAENKLIGGLPQPGDTYTLVVTTVVGPEGGVTFQVDSATITDESSSE